MTEKFGADVLYADNGAIHVDTIEQLDALLNRCHLEAQKTEPFLVEIMLSTGDALTIGLGRDLSLLSYVSSSGEPPYFVSVGDSVPDDDVVLGDDDVVVFYFCGTYTELPCFTLIPMELAREGARYFFQHASLPSFINWIEG